MTVEGVDTPGSSLGWMGTSVSSLDRGAGKFNYNWIERRENLIIYRGNYNLIDVVIADINVWEELWS